MTEEYWPAETELEEVELEDGISILYRKGDRSEPLVLIERRGDINYGRILKGAGK